MGADLYILSINDPLQEKYGPLFQEAVNKRNEFQKQGDTASADKIQEEISRYYNLMYSEGYFRDSYNNTSLLHQLDLSWWKDIGDKFLDDERYLQPDKAKVLYDIIKEREVPHTDELNLEGLQVDDENSPIVWYEYFVEKRENLLNFLMAAINKMEPIYCSI